MATMQGSDPRGNRARSVVRPPWTTRGRPISSPPGIAAATPLGSLAALILLAIPRSQSDTESWALKKLPLGTFLCIGGIVSSLWGQPMIAAYLRLAGF